MRKKARWDFKDDLKKSSALIPGTKDVQLGGYEFDYQALANIHYGYVGTAVGFPSLFLQVGAGIFQDEKTKGDITTYYDDPFDNYWIRFGIYLYNNYGSEGLTENEFLSALDEFIEKHGDPGRPITDPEKQKVY
ncbi:MAG: polymorphic toxin type 44 domain-containing protein [Chloroflexota bacterium]|nr:polymorphic toxin type 44 domain-containing protein [Chloroflexota bacterium]